MAGIQEIAEKAGVSISTVSYALNGSKKVTEKTRSRILKIAEEYSYSPNLAGRMLKKQKNYIIGLYLHDFGGYFYSHMIDGVNKVLSKNNYEVIVATGGSKTRDFISQGLVDGAIVLDSDFPDDMIKKYALSGKPIVVMDRKLSGDNITQVLLDNESGSKQAIQALNETDVDVFVIITGPGNSHDSNERLAAALKAIDESSDKPVKVIHSDFTIVGGHHVAKEIADMKYEKIGIFALNDEMAVGLIEELPTEKIGHDIQVIGFDNDIIGQYITPGLTTIDYSKHHWGSVAAETLLEMIDDRNQFDHKKILTHIQHRASLEKFENND